MCWLCSFVIFQGSGPVLLKEPCNFVVFQGGGSRPPPPAGSAHVRRFVFGSGLCILFTFTVLSRKEESASSFTIIVCFPL